MSALKEEMERVGMRSAKDRLHEVAINAMIKHADDQTAAENAIWSDIRRSATLMEALFWSMREQALRILIQDVRAELSFEKFKEEHGKRPFLKPKAERAHLISAEWGKREHTERVAELEAFDREEKRRADERFRISEERYRQSALAMFRINGMGVGDMSAASARAWAVKHAQDAIFVHRLTAGIPVTSTNPIKTFIKPDEADDIWRQTHAGAALP